MGKVLPGDAMMRRRVQYLLILLSLAVAQRGRRAGGRLVFDASVGGPQESAPRARLVREGVFRLGRLRARHVVGR